MGVAAKPAPLPAPRIDNREVTDGTRRGEAGLGDPVGLRRLGPTVRACMAMGRELPPGGRREPLDLSPELGDVLRNRLGPHALELTRRHAASGSDEELSDLATDAFNWSVLTSEVQRRSADALATLSAAGIPFVVVKGPAVARFYTSPVLRPFGDIDIVVEPGRFVDATRVLRGAGYRSVEQENLPRGWQATVCVEGFNYRGPSGGAIDVHHRIAPWCFSRGLHFADLKAAADPGMVGATPVLLASAAHGAVVAALHVVNDLWKGVRSLISWRDLLVLARHLGPAGFSDAFAGASLAWLLPELAPTLQGLDPGLVIAARSASTAADRLRVLRLRALGWDGTSSLVRHPAAWAARLPAPRALAYLAAWLVPRRGYVTSEHGGYRAYWAGALRSLRLAAKGEDLREGGQLSGGRP